VQVATGVSQVSAGGYHSLFIKSDGTLWAIGANDVGQLGDGTTTVRSTPVQIATGVSQVSAGGYHSQFLKNDGTLWAMGLNGEGQLGDGTTTGQSIPVQVATHVAQVSAGRFHTLFLQKIFINGIVTYNGSPLCAMVLANGQYMFTCGPDPGIFCLEVPLDENGEIRLFAFCSGLAPFEVVLTPDQALDFDVSMSSAPANSPTVTVESEPGTINPEWVRISGTVTYDGIPLCVMVLAGGQHMFTCTDPVGSFDMEVPLDEYGQIRLYAFCSGMEPYEYLFMP
jgi:hypothetical protein